MLLLFACIQPIPVPKDSGGVVNPDPTLATLVSLSGGTFMMGSPEEEADREPDEVRHAVILSPFWIMEREVTQGMWKEVLSGDNPSYFGACGDGCPVEMVSWCDVVWFANELSRLRGIEAAYSLPDGFLPGLDEANCDSLSSEVILDLSQPGYRLPTEAEWEIAARGGEEFVYAGSNIVNEVGWYIENSMRTTHPGCGLLRNRYDLFDMSGNVWEWTWDRYGDYADVPPGADPEGVSSGLDRVVRGGSWNNAAGYARVADRLDGNPGARIADLGFRLAGSGSLDP